MPGLPIKLRTSRWKNCPCFQNIKNGFGILKMKKNKNNSQNRPANRKGKSNGKKAEIVALFAIIEAISLVLWQKAEDFSGFSGQTVHWVSECGFLAGGAYVVHEFTKKPIVLWFIYAAICVVIFCTKSDSVKSPTIWPSHIQLCDGEWTYNSFATISNPNSIPLFDVQVNIVMNGKGVSVTSILTPLDFVNASGRVGMPAFMSFNDGSSGAFILDEIPANGNRQLQFQGTILVKSSADLSISSFKKTGEEHYYLGGPDLTMGGTPAHPPTNSTPANAVLQTHRNSGTNTN
jgi:hypothetical protein